ncbi:hypothetical protein HY479_02120 [Candidatus Uhrbacteria bacterium]|nr:hypothetical protein [Candidatus Uhrbacteria bacterium]
MLEVRFMTYSLLKKAKAGSLRRGGMSIPRIAKMLGMAKSTISLWVSAVPLPPEIRQQLGNNSMTGREKGRRLMEIERKRKQIEREVEARRIVKKQLIRSDILYWKHVASLLFWCEGGKRGLSSVVFANSDPELICAFLFALRKGFELQEEKFRGVMHLHEYHDEKAQRIFWSCVSNIPASQFTKSYRKPHTKKRTRENYQGCLSVRYHDANLARMLDALYHAFAQKITGAW